MTTVGSVVTLRDLSYKFEAMIEEIPFQWAQALFLITRLASKCCKLPLRVYMREEAREEK